MFAVGQKWLQIANLEINNMSYNIVIMTSDRDGYDVKEYRSDKNTLAAARDQALFIINRDKLKHVISVEFVDER